VFGCYNCRSWGEKGCKLAFALLAEESNPTREAVLADYFAQVLAGKIKCCVSSEAVAAVNE